MRIRFACVVLALLVAGLTWAAATNDGRGISSYFARMGHVMVVTNSLVQLERLGAVLAGDVPPLADSPEYVFFRDRYPRGAGETAFLILTDATIRRWCSPRWRIGHSFRQTCRFRG